MKQTSKSPSIPEESPTVVVVGGNGGWSGRYRQVVEELGWSLRHYEKAVPSSHRRSAGKIALVVIMVGMVSHALRDQARNLAQESQVVYLPSATASALRAAVERHAGAGARVERGG